MLYRMKTCTYTRCEVNTKCRGIQILCRGFYELPKLKHKGVLVATHSIKSSHHEVVMLLGETCTQKWPCRLTCMNWLHQLNVICWEQFSSNRNSVKLFEIWHGKHTKKAKKYVQSWHSHTSQAEGFLTQKTNSEGYVYVNQMGKFWFHIILTSLA
jgi:hypothetical protein